MKPLFTVILLACVVLTGCDLLQKTYRVEFRDGSWREIMLTPWSNEALWREGCRGEMLINEYRLPVNYGETVAGRQSVIIGGEQFELVDNYLYRHSGMVLGQSPDHIQRGLTGMEVCKQISSSRSGLPKLKTRGFN